MQRYFPGTRTFLDAGCRNGSLLVRFERSLPGVETAGADVGRAGLRIARARMPKIPLYLVDAGRLPFVDEFDVIGAFDLLEHVDDDIAVLRRLRTAVRPGGGVMVTVPQHPWLWSALDDISGHRRRYSRAQLALAMEEADLRIVRMTSFVSLLLPALWLSRLVGARSRKVDPPVEHRATLALDAPLGAIQQAELALIQAGVSFPAGGSLFAVARRIT